MKQYVRIANELFEELKDQLYDYGLDDLLSKLESDCEPFAPLQEDQHIITTEQIKDLRSWIGSKDYSTESVQNMLLNWFPTAFQPASTYNIRLEVENLTQEEYTACIGNLQSIAKVMQERGRDVLLEETKK